MGDNATAALLEIHGDPGAHELAVGFFRELSSTPNGYRRCIQLLTDGTAYDNRCKSIFLQIIKTYMTKSYDATSPDDVHQTFRHFVVDYMREQLGALNVTKLESPVNRTLAADICATICLSDYPARWGEFFATLTSAVGVNAKTSYHCLEVLIAVSNRLLNAQLQHKPTSEQQRAAITKAFHESDLERVLDTLCEIINSYSQLINKCLSTLKKLMEWIDVEKIKDHRIKDLMTILLYKAKYRCASAECYTQLVSTLKPAHRWRSDFLETVFLDIYALQYERILSSEKECDFGIRMTEMMNAIGLKTIEIYIDGRESCDPTTMAKLAKSVSLKFGQVYTFLRSPFAKSTMCIFPFMKRYFRLVLEDAEVMRDDNTNIELLLNLLLTKMTIGKNHALSSDEVAINEPDSLMQYRHALLDVLKTIAEVYDADTYKYLQDAILKKIEETNETSTYQEAEYTIYLLNVLGQLFYGNMLAVPSDSETLGIPAMSGDHKTVRASSGLHHTYKLAEMSGDSHKVVPASRDHHAPELAGMSGDSDRAVSTDLCPISGDGYSPELAAVARNSDAVIPDNLVSMSGDHRSVKPEEPEGHRSIKDMFGVVRAVLSSPVINHNHPVVVVQIFQTLSTPHCLDFLQTERELTNKMLSVFVDKGVRSKNVKVCCKCALPLSMFLRRLNAHVAHSCLGVFTYMSQLLDLANTEGHVIFQRKNRNAQLHFYEAAATCIKISKLSSTNRRQLLRYLVKPSRRLFLKSLNKLMTKPGDETSTDRLRADLSHCISLWAMISQGFDDRAEVETFGCDDLFIELVSDLFQCPSQMFAHPNVHSPTIHFMRRMMVCLEPKRVAPYAPKIAANLAKCSHTIACVCYYGQFIVEAIQTFQHEIVQFLKVDFGRIACHVFDFLHDAFEKSKSHSEKDFLSHQIQEQVISLYFPLVETGMLAVVMRQMDMYYVLKSFYMVTYASVVGRVFTAKVKGFQILAELVHNWGTPTNKLQEANVESAFNFLIKSMFQCLKEIFDDVQVTEEERQEMFYVCSRLTITLYRRRGQRMSIWLTRVYLPLIQVDLARSIELIRGLKLDPEYFTVVLFEFFLETRMTMSTNKMPSFSQMLA